MNNPPTTDAEVIDVSQYANQSGKIGRFGSGWPAGPLCLMRGISQAEKKRRVAFGKAATTHGMHGTPEYDAWAAMWQRCSNPRNPNFKHYGGRGIKVCKRWKRFENFLADMGRRHSLQFTLERKNNAKGYNPENCIWALQSDQLRNTRRTVLFTIAGTTKCLKDWCAFFGTNYGTARSRIRRGWSSLDSARTPTLTQYRKKFYGKRN